MWFQIQARLNEGKYEWKVNGKYVKRFVDSIRNECLSGRERDKKKQTKNYKGPGGYGFTLLRSVTTNSHIWYSRWGPLSRAHSSSSSVCLTHPKSRLIARLGRTLFISCSNLSMWPSRGREMRPDHSLSSSTFVVGHSNSPVEGLQLTVLRLLRKRTMPH